MADSYLSPALYLTWQDPHSRRIFPVGRLLRLTEPAGAYEFAYVEGAIEAREHGFVPFIDFGALDEIVHSLELPPLFANRVMRTGRPDYANYVGRLGLALPADPQAILARSNGPRATDSLEIFAEPERLDDGRWEAVFLVRAIRHVEGGEEVAASLGVGEQLFPVPDEQNLVDPNAVLLRTATQQTLGYCPHYLTDQLAQRLAEDPEARVTVLQMNPRPAPAHYRVLCSLRLHTKNGHPPFRSSRLEPISKSATALEGGRARRVA